MSALFDSIANLKSICPPSMFQAVMRVESEAISASDEAARIYRIGEEAHIKLAGYVSAALAWDARERELLAQRDELLAALKYLLSDTQHKEHECIDELCPVKVAEAAIAKAEGGGA